MRGRLCALQMHHTDVVPALARYNAVERLRDSGFFERVVLAAADVPENDVLLPWAERFGVELFRGHAEDVARRLLDCAVRHRCDVVARALTWWFFIDLELVEAQLGLLEEGDAEYVDLPLDFDLRFGADVMRRGFLERAAREAPARFRRNPWGFAAAFPARFVIETHEDVPVYGRAAFDRIKRGVRELWPEQHDGAATPLHPYHLALELLPRGGRVLDVACGKGRHALLLAGAGFDVRAIDRNPEAVEFVRGTAAKLGFRIDAGVVDLETDPPPPLSPAAFDAVLVFNYLHRPLMPALRESLKPGGRMFYETFTTRQAERGHPRNPAFLLRDGELPELMAPLSVVRSREGEFDERFIASVVAERR